VADIETLLDIFYRAMDELMRTRGREPLPRNPRLLGSLLHHLFGEDPAASFVADDYGQAVGFAVAHRRDDVGFLSFMFVLPDHQRRGIGRSLLRACYDALGRPSTMSTCAEADQPVATGLYASMGMAPRLPLYLLTGELEVAAFPSLPVGLEAARLEAGDADELDAATLGYRRLRDHGRLRRDEHQGWRLAAADGNVVGYGYAHASGRLGPIATIDPDLLPALVGHLIRSIQPAGAWQIIVPGPAVTVLPLLLGSGMRIDGTPAMYCAAHAGPRFDRYLPMSFALL
jgi:GNAT superfamily N-acetyltransferase